MARKTLRGIIEGDYHCGHWAGLTPPDFYANPNSEDSDILVRHKAQKELWQWRSAKLKQIGRVDFHILNADLIDGRGERSGGTELQIVDRNKQVAAAIQCAKVVLLTKNGRRCMTRGTPYHTGDAEDFEDNIADALDCPIADRIWPEINGVIFDVRHKVGGSSVPHGRFAALARQKLWNMLLSGDGSHANHQPRAQVTIRSHVHYHTHVGGAGWVAMNLPCLQYPMSKYGSRQCDGAVDMGLTYWEVKPSGNFTWEPLICRPEAAKAEPLKLLA